VKKMTNSKTEQHGFSFADSGVGDDPGVRHRVIAMLARELTQPLESIAATIDGLDELLPAHRRIREEVARAQRLVAELAGAAGRRILIVEDNPDAARLLAECVEGRGFRVAVATDGQSAQRLFLEFHPDVAILDIGLPTMSGYDVARWVRARPDGTEVKLIALTAYSKERDRTDALAAGFDVHLTKPVTASALLSLLLEPRHEAHTA
jgi:CheY-like chemotaxis protein